MSDTRRSSSPLPDITSEFTSFLCNGHVTLLGSIKLEPNLIRLIRGEDGTVLEQFPYSNVASVNEEEPETFHSLIINLRTRPVYLSHLLRKEKLLKVFKELGLYQESVKLPAEALGFLSGDALKDMFLPDSELYSEPPPLEDYEDMEFRGDDQYHQQDEHGYSYVRVPRHGETKDAQDSWSVEKTSGSGRKDHVREKEKGEIHAEETGSSRRKYTAVSGAPAVGTQSKARVPVRVVPARTAAGEQSSYKQPRARSSKQPSSSRYSGQQTQQLEDMKMLFPNHSEDELRRVLSEAKFDLDEAISVILAHDNLANALSAEDLVVHDDFDRPQTGAIIGWEESFLGKALDGESPITTALQPRLLKLSQVSNELHQFVTSEVAISISQLQHGDILAAKCKQKFWALCQEMGREDLYGSLSIVAGFLLCENNDIKNSVVVALGSGATCLPSNCVADMDGTSLYDMHAVVIARRSLVRFFCEQIVRVQNQANSIFTVSQGKLQLLSSLTLHLYISTIPCGDARVFEGSGLSADSSGREYSGRHSKLRVMQDQALDAIPVSDITASLEQDIDAILNGHPLRCMSCSDKLALWNTVGVQGSFLSQFVHPLYVASIVVGARGMSTNDHLKRAFYGRLPSMPSLPEGYFCNIPQVFISAKYAEDYQSMLPQSEYLSFNWYCNTQLEIIDAITGKLENNGASRLSKSMLFRIYQQLCGRVGQSTLSYREEKARAGEYRRAKQATVEAFASAGCGNWLRKPKEIENFH